MAKNKQFQPNLDESEIIKFIFKGFSSEQIAGIVKCSRSTVSQRIKVLFKKYCVSNRREFILLLISKLISEKQQIIDSLVKENLKFKKFLLTLCENNKNTLEFRQCISEIKAYLKC